MANQKHLEILGQGVTVWNQWRKENQDIKPNLSGTTFYETNLSRTNLSRIDLAKADLSRADLVKADLRRANLRRANLIGANLTEANLIGANLIGANLIGAELSRIQLLRAYLSGANLSETNLSGAFLRKTDLSGANLSGANLSRADLIEADLIEADLRKANLIEADLIGSDLRKADLRKANLSGANLTAIRVLNTNFEEATLTGTCIEDWNINTKTNLKNTKCNYVFLSSNWDEEKFKRTFIERRPHQKDKIFKPGDFEKLVIKAQETIDLIFRNGINWQAFLNSYEQLKNEAGGDFFPIHSIENRDDTSLVVKLESPPETDKEAIEFFFEERYREGLKIIEDKYRIQLEAKDEIIETHKQKYTDILELAKLAASKSINVEAKAMANDNSETFHNYQQGAYIANNANVVRDNARQQANQYNSTPEQKQSLADAATEIQQLLDQFSETYSTEEAERKVAEDLVYRAKQDPSFKEKLKNWSLSLANQGAEVSIGEIAKEGTKRAIQMAIALLI